MLTSGNHVNAHWKTHQARSLVAAAISAKLAARPRPQRQGLRHHRSCGGARSVLFSRVVENRFGFDDLRKGQQLEYTLENAPYLRAASVRVATTASVHVLRPA